jgi:hypothetical protein
MSDSDHSAVTLAAHYELERSRAATRANQYDPGSDYISQRAQAIFIRAHGGGCYSESDAALYRMYAVLSFAKGAATTAKDVHDAWSAWVSDAHPDHRSLKPFDELTPDVQRMDDLYVQAIHWAASQFEYAESREFESTSATPSLRNFLAGR